MPRPRKAAPTPDETVSVFEGAEGWQGFLTIGTRPDGRPDRRKRRGKDEAEVRRKLAELQAKATAGDVAKPGRVPKLAAFLDAWLNDPNRTWRYNTRTGTYPWAVHSWIIPRLGEWRLDRLLDNPGALDAFFRGLEPCDDCDSETSLESPSQRLAPSSVQTIFSILRAALNAAVRQRIIARNPVDFMQWRPTLGGDEVTPLYVDEVKSILRVCEGRRNGTRWTIGLPLGLRQGEALGLPWMKPATSTRDKPIGLDVDGGWMVVRQQTERRTWRHGCDDPVACAREHCRATPCPTRWAHGCGKPPEECTKHRADRCPQRRPAGTCRRHRDVANCRELCPVGCTGHGNRCPKRVGGGIVFVNPKTEAGKRRIALAVPMIEQLRRHLIEQDAERDAAGDAWEDYGLVWCQPNGKPIDARADWQEWKEILRLAGVRDARVHDGRHTAATMLLLQGVDEQTVMAVMGWSDRRMVQRYQHVIDELRVEASRRLGDLLYGPGPGPEPGKPKKKRKKSKQAKEKKMNIETGRSATDLATRAGEAKIIPFRRSA